MKFKLTSTSDSSQLAGNSDGLQLLYSDDVIRFEAEKFPVTKCVSPKGSSVFCLGRIIGKVNKNGSLAKLKSLSKFLTECIDTIDLFEVVEMLDGRFILVVINNEKKECYFCADKFSKLDTYIQQSESTITLCSDLSLLPEDPAKDGYDQAALVHMLTYYGYCPPKKHTIYNSVKRLGVRQMVTINQGTLNITDVPLNPIKTKKYTKSQNQEYTELFLNHLKVAGSSQGNVVYLSSGWDSTSIVAGLVHIYGSDKVRAITGRMRYSDRSGVCNQVEIDKATQIAKYYGIKLDIVDFEYVENGHDHLDNFKSMMKDNQLYALTAYTHGKLAEKTKATAIENNEVVFAGEISDGAHNLGFSQYATIFHPSYGFREYSDKMASYLFGPTFLTLFINNEHLFDPVFDLFKRRQGSAIFDSANDEKELRTLQLLTSFFLRNGRIPLWSIENSRLLTKFGAQSYTEEMQSKYLNVAAKNATPETIYAWYLYLYNSFHWQGGTVRSLQVFADFYNLDSDLPFWDSGIQEFLSAMPEDWGRGLDLNPTKYPLKEMLRTKIDYPYEIQEGPHSYTYDVDHSFNHMVEIFQHSKMKKKMQKILANKHYHEILSPDYFDLDYIDNLVDEYVAGVELSVASCNELVPIAMLSYVGWYNALDSNN